MKALPLRFVAVASALLLLLFASPLGAQPKPLPLDKVHSRIGFTASTILFDVDGHFEKYDVLVDGSLDEPAKAQIRVNVDASSVNTGVGKRDKHLRSPAFFDVAKHPRLTFTSKRLALVGSQLTVTGVLEIRGRKEEISIPFKVVKGKNGQGKATTAYRGELVIDRNDFGVGADSVAAKISLQDEVRLHILIVSKR